jgi:hypothetical protein
MSYTYDEKSTDSYYFIGGIQQDLRIEYTISIKCFQEDEEYKNFEDFKYYEDFKYFQFSEDYRFPDYSTDYEEYEDSEY